LPRNAAMEPVGEMLVSYTAGEMPTDVLTRIARETLEDHEAGLIPASQALRLCGWLLRIALQKIESLEGVAA
jgi:hypothetical protein